MNKFEACAMAVMLSVGLAACSSTPVAPPPANQPTVTPTPAATSSVVPAPATSSTVSTVSLPLYLDPKSRISRERSVYFDFDDFSIKSEYNGLIQLHGTYLESHPSVAIKIEGNADERGSNEYNLALGQKRAEAVLKALKIFGVKDAQMEAISWGKERPKASGHDEAAWAQNRRADLVYPQQ